MRVSDSYISTCNDLPEHGRHPKSLQGGLRHRYCVPRCVPRGLNCGYHVLIETQGSDLGSTPFQINFSPRKNSLRSNSRGDLPQLGLWTVKGQHSPSLSLYGANGRASPAIICDRAARSKASTANSTLILVSLSNALSNGVIMSLLLSPARR